MAKTIRPKNVVDNRSRQLNSRHPAFWRARGYPPDEAQKLAKLGKIEPQQEVQR